MLRGGSACTDSNLVVRCDYVNEHVNVKLALSFCTTWLNILLLLLLTIGHEAGHYCHFRVLHSVNSATGRKKKKRERGVLEKKKKEKKERERERKKKDDICSLLV